MKNKASGKILVIALLVVLFSLLSLSAYAAPPPADPYEALSVNFFNGTANICIEGNSGTSSAGGTIDLWTWWANSWYYAWRLVPDANHEYFQIRRQTSATATATTALAPTGGTVAAGTRLTLAAGSTTADNQWWKFERQSSGRYLITSKANPALCMAPISAASGQGIQLANVPQTPATADTWRILIQNTAATAASQLVTADQPLASVAAQSAITVAAGTAVGALGLPSRVNVVYVGGATGSLAVNWNTASYNGSVAGTYALSGTLILSGLAIQPATPVTASINVIVEGNAEPFDYNRAACYTAAEGNIARLTEVRQLTNATEARYNPLTGAGIERTGINANFVNDSYGTPNVQVLRLTDGNRPAAGTSNGYLSWAFTDSFGAGNNVYFVLNWGQPYTIDAVRCDWWTDANVTVPNSAARIEWLDQTTWREVTNMKNPVTGAAVTNIGTLGMGNWNPVTFDPVVTTQLRMRLSRTGTFSNGIGVGEWEVFGTPAQGGLVNAEYPVITLQPVGKTVSAGETATLTVAATVTKGTLSYQWYSGNAPGVLIAGATNASYNAPTTVGGSTSYFCMITNTDNEATGSKTATVTSQVVNVMVTGAGSPTQPEIAEVRIITNNMIELWWKTPTPTTGSYYRYSDGHPDTLRGAGSSLNFFSTQNSDNANFRVQLNGSTLAQRTGTFSPYYWHAVNYSLHQVRMNQHISTLRLNSNLTSAQMTALQNGTSTITVQVIGNVTNRAGEAADTSKIYTAIYKPYYDKEITAKTGLTIKGSEFVDIRTVQKAADITDVILSAMPQAVVNMISSQGAFLLFGPGEHSGNIPEQRNVITYDEFNRAEGYGGSNAATSAANVERCNVSGSGNTADYYPVGYRSGYQHESILAHEFGHKIQTAFNSVYASTHPLRQEFNAAFSNVTSRGMWTAYVRDASGGSEYFATMTSVWYNGMSEGNAANCNTRDELFRYDRRAYDFFSKIYSLDKTVLSPDWANCPNTAAPNYNTGSPLPNTTVQTRTLGTVAPQDTITVSEGTAIGSISLPTKVQVAYTDSFSSSPINWLSPYGLDYQSVTWNTSSYNGNTPGTYTLEGTLNPVYVGKYTGDSYITDVLINPNNIKASLVIVVQGAIPVTDVIGVPVLTVAGTPLTLVGTVVPADATDKTIVWSIKDAGVTGATIIGNVLNTTAAGTVVVTASVGAAFFKDFNITVDAAPELLKDGEILKRFVVDAPHAAEYTTENASTVHAFEPNSVETMGVVDPFFAQGGTLFAPTNRKEINIYVIAVDFSDIKGGNYMPYSLQRNVWNDSTGTNNVLDLSKVETHYYGLFLGRDALNACTKIPNYNSNYKAMAQRMEQMSMGRWKVNVICLNEVLAEAQGLDPDNDVWPWITLNGTMMEYAVQGPADCEDYRQFARVHQSGINAAYAQIEKAWADRGIDKKLDLENMDFIFTVVPYNTHGYRSGLQGGSGLDTSFSYNDQSMLQRDSEYRHEPGVKTRGGRMVGSGVFGVKGIWTYSPSGIVGAVTTAMHEFTHGMGMFDDYSYGSLGTNTGETTGSGAGNYGVMGSSMNSSSPDLPIWRKYRMGWIDDDELMVVLPGDTVTVNLRASGSYLGDGGTYTDDPAIKTRMVVIPKEWRTRDTFGVNDTTSYGYPWLGNVWNCGWNSNKMNYNWYDWFTNPWVGGETNAIKSFPTFYTLETRKALGLDSTIASGAAGVVVSYIANSTWETGHGAGGFKIATASNTGLKANGTFTDPHIGLTVRVNTSNVFYDNVTITYTGEPTSAAQHTYLGILKASNNYVTAGQEFDVDFDIMTLGCPAPNDAANSVSATVTRRATPLGVPGGVAGFTMTVTFDAANLEYVSVGNAPFSYTVTETTPGTLLITANGNRMIDKDTILSLKFKAKAGAAEGNYTVGGRISGVKLLNWRGEELGVGAVPGFNGVGTIGAGTFAAFHANTSNTLTNNYISSFGGSVAVGNVPTFTVSGSIVCDTPGPAPNTFIGIESTVQVRSGATVLGTAKSDWDGNFSVKGIPAGTGYTIYATKSKYTANTSATFDVAADTKAPQLKLNRQTFTVSGRIFGSYNSDGTGASPLVGVDVYLINIGNAYSVIGGPAKTDASGNYTVSGIEVGRAFVAVAVSVKGTQYEDLYLPHFHLAPSLHLPQMGITEPLEVSLGMKFGENPSDYNYPSGSGTLGTGGVYCFANTSNRTGRDITLTQTQDIRLRMTTKSAAISYQVRDLDGNAVGSPVNSLGNANGDDIIRNVAPGGPYYVEASRNGYISGCTPIFEVYSSRVILRNNVSTNTMDLQATGSGQTLAGTVYNAITRLPMAGVKIQNLPNSATYGAGAPIFTSDNGTFSYLTVNTARDIVYSKEGFITQRINRAAGAASGLAVYLMPLTSDGELEVELIDVEKAKPGDVAVATFAVTNTGSIADYVYLSMEGVEASLPSVIEIGAGETIDVPVTVEITPEVFNLAAAGEKYTFTAKSATNEEKAPVSVCAYVKDLIIYDYTAYLAGEEKTLKIGDTLLVDIMLVGGLNYTQLSADIAYDTALLEFAGYADLQGWVASVSPLAGGKISVRSVPSMNMVLGETCATDVKIVTLKFTVKDGFADESIETALSFAALVITGPAGYIGATTYPSNVFPVTLLNSLQVNSEVKGEFATEEYMIEEIVEELLDDIIED